MLFVIGSFPQGNGAERNETRAKDSKQSATRAGVNPRFLLASLFYEAENISENVAAEFRGPANRPRQKSYRSANCITLAAPALLIWPKFTAVREAAGVPRFTQLIRL